jgi:hypothetical protein
LSCKKIRHEIQIVKTRLNLVDSSKEGHGSKRAGRLAKDKQNSNGQIRIEKSELLVLSRNQFNANLAETHFHYLVASVSSLCGDNKAQNNALY